MAIKQRTKHLNMRGGPGSDFKVALSEPAAHELKREWKRGWRDVRG